MLSNMILIQNEIEAKISSMVKKKKRQEITTFHRGQKVIQWKRHRLWNQKYFNSAFSSFIILGKLHLFTETPFSHLEDCDIHGVLIKMKLDIR